MVNGVVHHLKYAELRLKFMKAKLSKNVKYLFVDLETKSREPIENGPARYFADPAADWLICSTKLRGLKTKSITNFSGTATQAIPDKILEHPGIFVAHNWFFEWSFFNRFYPGTRAADWRNWLCTAALARWFGICIPRAKLEDVAFALGMEKMPEGKTYIGKYSIPQKDGSFLICKDKSDDAKGFVKYCETDAELSEGIFDTLDGRGFNIEEFRAAQAIDVRGVPVDVEAAKFLIKRKESDKAHAIENAEKIAGRTNGKTLVLSGSGSFIDFFDKKFGIQLPDAKATTLDILDFSDHPKADEIEHVLYIRKLLVARAGDKAQAILDRAINDRVYNACIFHAAGTGRFQSWGVNFFNFSRKSVEDWEKEKNTASVPALQRGIVCAPKGKVLIESDWRGIENYLSLYIAGDTEQLKRIEAGESPYLIFGEKLFGKKITKEDKEYVPAKAGVLSCGYGAGEKKIAMINNLPLQTAKFIRDGWHRNNQPIVGMWKEFYDAFSFALIHGKTSTVRGFKFEQLGKTSVKITLLNGHVLYYRNLTTSLDNYGRPCIKRDGQVLHGGLLTENLMQATCACLLRRALVTCEKHGLKVVLHVYDSIMIESVVKEVKRDATKLEKIMKDPPEWAPGLKLAVDIKTGQRWSK